MLLMIDRVESDIILFLADQKRIIKYYTYQSDTVDVGTICIGRVSKVNKSINVAFIKIDEDTDAILPLNKYKKYYVKNTNNKEALVESDEILVQVVSHNSGDKLITVSNVLNINSDNFVLTTDKSGAFISKKIEDSSFRDFLVDYLNKRGAGDIGIIARTSSFTTSEEILIKELDELIDEFHTIIDKSVYKSLYTKVFTPRKSYHKFTEDLSKVYEFDIVTYDKKMHEELLNYHKNSLLISKEDFISKKNIYSIKEHFKDLYRKRVLLKSGALLIIEKTQAMHVIDVNTHKKTSKKSAKEALLATNIEAWNEIIKQIEARNLTGIIIIDFINMKDKAAEKTLLEHINKTIKETDKTITNHGLTNLSLLELTRKRTHIDLYDDKVVKKYCKN